MSLKDIMDHKEYPVDGNETADLYASLFPEMKQDFIHKDDLKIILKRICEALNLDIDLDSEIHAETREAELNE